LDLVATQDQQVRVLLVQPEEGVEVLQVSLDQQVDQPDLKDTQDQPDLKE
jgi:hypothetical protein